MDYDVIGSHTAPSKSVIVSTVSRIVARSHTSQYEGSEPERIARAVQDMFRRRDDGYRVNSVELRRARRTAR